MPDVLTSAQRHYCMSQIHSKNTSIEVALCAALRKRGYGYRKNYKALPGTPDIALTKYRIAIFCDGELFHGKDWEVLRPRLAAGSNPDYWVGKIERNMERDQETDKRLQFMGWTVVHFWGKDILSRPDDCVRVVEDIIFDNKIGTDVEDTVNEVYE